MKKHLFLIVVLLAIAFVTVQPVVADTPDFALDTCILMKGNKIYGRNLFLVENVPAGSTATFTMTGYNNNPQYTDFGLSKVKGEKFSYTITEGYVGEWGSLYKLGEDSQTVSVEINGVVHSAHVMSITEALAAFLSGDVNPCPIEKVRPNGQN
ncbi:MAG: hypothetical protein XD87_0472 [candidate division WS6 bacterium 36_33]|uniref:Transmembrane(S)protein n=1 Tax=candidate division WS6 bacterium 36_33 TaxID=1641388 RepID=A0A117LTL1_9BACT|nr:MAG: hypothetical protein XD87_0472 [candidate division WS6 bacterium 36_33]